MAEAEREVEDMMDIRWYAVGLSVDVATVSEDALSVLEGEELGWDWRRAQCRRAL